MTRPIWFLDIDGVVNAAGDNLRPHLVRTEATTAGTTWPIHYSPEVVKFINMVHRAGLVEIRWLTTWGEDARTSFAPAVGLDDFPAYDMYDSGGWWKAEIVEASILDESRPFVWTDDDIAEEQIARFAGSVDEPTLLVSPSTEVGLTSADLRRVLEFVSAINVQNIPHPRTVTCRHISQEPPS